VNGEGNNGEGNKDTALNDGEGVVDDEVIDPAETVVLTEVDVDDGLAETVDGLDVDAMVSKIENADSGELAKQREAKKRLDKVQEKLDKDDQFGSTYTFDIDEDLPT
jgi:hypothetical protein